MALLFKRLLYLGLGAVLFFVVFAFALNNREAVVLHWFWGYEQRMQLALLVLIALGLGIGLGVLSMLPLIWRLSHPGAAHEKPSLSQKGEETGFVDRSDPPHAV